MKYKGITVIEVIVSLTIVAILGLIVLGCIANVEKSERSLEHGEVVNMEYRPEKTYLCKSGNVLVPCTREEAYYLTIQNGKEKDTFEVSESEYFEYSIGDAYPKEQEESETE